MHGIEVRKRFRHKQVFESPDVAEQRARFDSIVSFGALFDPLSAPKLDPGKYMRSPWIVDEKCITRGVNVGL